MFDKIIYISDQSANIKLKEDSEVVINLMNLHLIFEDKDKTILGEVDDLEEGIVRARFLGEISNGRLIGGVLRKPSLDAKIRVIKQEEIPLITGEDKQGFMPFGVSPYYNDFPVYLDVNNFFSNHFAIFGNSGSGKSCGISRIMQNMFEDERLFPYKSNILLFDSSGEYYNAFKDLNKINSNYNYRFITTNETEGKGETLRLPIFLLNEDDLSLLLQATNHSQLPIIERMLKLARIFASDGVDANKYKNHLIAKAIMTILYTNQTAPNKRNDIFSIINSCSTNEFNLDAPVQGIGYVRKFRECFLIDNHGQFSESVLLTEYVSSFINDEYDNYEPSKKCYYTLDDLEKALNFTLISEGWLRNENTYGDSVTLKVRLHSLITSSNSNYFKWEKGTYISLENYLSDLMITNGKKYQLVNINLDDVDDSFAKVITKIYSRLLFEFTKSLKERASIPFHIFVEEAHRYIQNDTDRFLIGYNIFERIAKEGRKYGLILGLITQRPVEMSDTVISQCSNFLIFKMNHPTDVEYIKKMVPNISDEIVEKQKSLQSGTCLAFGSAFKIPLIVKLKMPNPMPMSGNCDVVRIWDGHSNTNVNNNQQVEINNNVTTNINNDINTSTEVQNDNLGIPEININDKPINNVSEPINEVNNIEQSPINEIPTNDVLNKENNSFIINDIPNDIPNNNSIIEPQNNSIIENNIDNNVNELPNINNQSVEQPINNIGITDINTQIPDNNIGQQNNMEHTQFNIGENNISPIPEININNNETL